MSYSHRINYIQSKTLALVAIVGKMHQGGEETILGELKAAKNIALEMAVELNMAESLQEWEIDDNNFVGIPMKLAILVGHLAKTCEAFDHLENFPYRETLEENIRSILAL